MTVYTKRIFITSGTSFIVPTDFDPLINLIECYGSSTLRNASLGPNAASSGGAYAAGTNIPVLPGHIVNIVVGAITGSSDTCFNATSLANAVSAGPASAVAAQGAYYQLQRNAQNQLYYQGYAGVASSSVGNAATFSGGTGSSGGGGCGGPNGNGGNGGPAGVFPTTGGGGGGSNGGSNAAGENGGNNRLGSGGSTSPLSPGVAGGGGCGGNSTNVNGSSGSLDDIYSDGIHGPGSGGGGAYSNNIGGNAGGYGSGGGLGSVSLSPNSNANDGIPTSGLIVVSYDPLYGVDSVLIG